MEFKQMFLLLVVGVAIGAVGLYGAAITGYVPAVTELLDARAAGINADISSPMALAARDTAVVRDVIRSLKAENVLKDGDKIFVHRATLATSDGMVHGIEALFVGVIGADGVLDADRSMVLKDRLMLTEVKDRSMIMPLTSRLDIVAEGAVIRAIDASTIIDGQTVFNIEASEIFNIVGIENTVPFGIATGGDNTIS